MGLGGLVMGREWEGELGSSSDMGIIVWRQQGGDDNKNESTSDSKHMRARGLPAASGQRREGSQKTEEPARWPGKKRSG